MATLLGASSSVPAHKVADASMAPSTVASFNRPSSLEHLRTDKAARSNTVLTPRQNPASSPIISSAYRDQDRTTPGPATDSAASQTTHVNSKWRFLAALLGTLGIIGTIAVRRRKPGKPWA
ncbi:hypothetical protein [Polaromonas sp.]|uniref:hypothetical protein n=1 Tax=Polaromonas sp. TaxID=1869339 RepID=UPI0013B66D13|nr:hypothetical protein [Polaromonas sp.]NDP64969.1 hypothetical protein [Polaromonas sp.]